MRDATHRRPDFARLLAVSALLVVISTMAACMIIVPAAETGGTTEATAATEVITYVPSIPTGAPQEGSCFAGSLAVARENVWRCMSGNEILDPCFALPDSSDLVCGADPVQGEDGFLLKLTEPLPEPEPVPPEAQHAWMVELEDGSVCGFATGATGGIDGERVNYLCPKDDDGSPVGLVGELDHSQPLWTARRVVIQVGPDGWEAVESASIAVTRVWQ